MEILENILKKIQFPLKYYNFNFKKSEKQELDCQGYIEIQKININNEYIEFFVYRSRENTEYWKSIDIYIKAEKSENVLNLIYQTNNIEFKLINNNEKIYYKEIDDLNRFEIFKQDNRLLIQITRFNN